MPYKDVSLTKHIIINLVFLVFLILSIIALINLDSIDTSDLSGFDVIVIIIFPYFGSVIFNLFRYLWFLVIPIIIYYYIYLCLGIGNRFIRDKVKNTILFGVIILNLVLIVVYMWVIFRVM